VEKTLAVYVRQCSIKRSILINVNYCVLVYEQHRTEIKCMSCWFLNTFYP